MSEAKSTGPVRSHLPPRSASKLSLEIIIHELTFFTLEELRLLQGAVHRQMDILAQAEKLVETGEQPDFKPHPNNSGIHPEF